MRNIVTVYKFTQSQSWVYEPEGHYMITKKKVKNKSKTSSKGMSAMGNMYIIARIYRMVPS